MRCMSKPVKASSVWLRRLQTPARIDNQSQAAAGFIYALRLLAVYHAAGRDPAAELAVRMESMTAALCTIELSHMLLHAWPEPVTVNRYCCKLLSHDEATIALMLNAAAERDKEAFERALTGLVRRERIARLWDRTVMLMGAQSTLAWCPGSDRSERN